MPVQLTCPGCNRLADNDRKRSHRMLTDIQYQRFGDRVYWATVSTINTNGMEYDINKFFKSVRVNCKPKYGLSLLQHAQ